MKALVADTIATKCGGNSNANGVDFFGNMDYFTSGQSTLSTPIWLVCARVAQTMSR